MPLTTDSARLEASEHYIQTSYRKTDFFSTLSERIILLREGIKKEIDFFLGNSPKQRTPPTHCYGLGLT